MAHKKRVACCRSKPRCDDCPVLALAAAKSASKGAKNKSKKRR